MPRKAVERDEFRPPVAPDGRYAIFQSDFFERPQVFVATDFTYPE